MKQKPYTYGFLIHLRHIDDVDRKFPFFKILPRSVKFFLTSFFPPVAVSRISGLKNQKTGEELTGLVVSIPLTAKQMLENRSRAVKQIIRALTFAQKRGVRLMGLGALTASLTRGGLDVVGKTSVSVTTGHAYTVLNVTQTLLNIIRDVGQTTDEVTLAIVGASGSIGSNSARIISQYPFKKILLIDVERKNAGLAQVLRDIHTRNPSLIVETSHQIGDIKEADFIITATNAPEALVKNSDLKMGAVIIDDAQPSDIHEEVFANEDVLVLEAGAVATPGVKTHFNLDLKNEYDNFSCLAEAMVLAAHGNFNNFVTGNVSLEHITEIKKLSEPLGFSVAEYQNQKEKISKEKLTHIKAIIKRQYT